MIVESFVGWLSWSGSSRSGNFPPTTKSARIGPPNSTPAFLHGKLEDIGTSIMPADVQCHFLFIDLVQVEISGQNRLAVKDGPRQIATVRSDDRAASPLDQFAFHGRSEPHR